MKKILSIAGAIALAASLFVACSSEVADDGRNSYIDTYKLEAVDITVKAYPGYNFVSWGSSKDGVTPTILRDDGKKITATTGLENGAIDTDIKGGVKYTYTAYVSTDKGKEVHTAFDGTDHITTSDNQYKTYYAVKGNSKSASVTAIAPDVYNSKGELTTALDLTNCQNAGSKDYVISEKNLRVNKITDVLGNTYFKVSFPTKAYLKYTVLFYHGNSLETFTDAKMPDTDKDATLTVGVNKNFYKMDNTYAAKVPVTAAGAWKIWVKVVDWNDTPAYEPSYVAYKEPITIDTLDTTGRETTIVNAAYVANSNPATNNGYIDEGKTIRIVWKPARNANNKDWSTKNYKVYVADGVNKSVANYTAIEAEVKTDTQNTEPVYYVDYTVADNTAPYNFYVVLSDNGKVEASNKSVTVYKYNPKAKVVLANTDSVTTSFVDSDKTGVSDDAIITFKLASNETTNKSNPIKVTSVKYKVLDQKDNTEYTADSLILDSELSTAAAVPTVNDYTTVVAAAKNVKLGSKVVFLYTLSQTGKADLVNVVTTTGKSNADVTIQAGEFSFAFSEATAASYYKGKFTIIPAADATTPVADKDTNFDGKALYTYTVQYALLESGASVAGITDWKSASVAIKWDTTALAWKGESADDVDFTKIMKAGSKNDLDDSNGAKQNGAYSGTIVFKYTKTLKAETANGASASNYVTKDILKPAE